MLTQSPPPLLDQWLCQRGIGPDDRKLCTNTDIDRLGHYHPQWLVATDDRVWVVFVGKEVRVLHEVAFDQATEFRAQSVVGSGLLQARVSGAFVDLLRYSNRLADRFEKIARKLNRRVAGEPIVVHDDEQADKRPDGPANVKRAAVLTRMWRLMRPYRRSALMMMGLLLVGIALDLVSPQLTRILVDRVLPRSPEAAATLQARQSEYDSAIGMLLTVVLVLAGVQTMRMMVNMLNGRLSSRVGTAITFDMRNRLVEHLQKLSVSYYDRQQVGSLVGRVAYDTESLHGFINQLTSGFLFQLIMIVGVGIMMFSINPVIATYALLPAPLVICGSIFFWRYVYPRYYRAWDASSKQAGMLSGIRVVKAFAQERREQDRFGQASDYLRQSRRGVEYGVAAFNPLMGLLFQLGGWIVWFTGGKNVIQGHMSLGELMAFFGYLWMFYGPLATLTQLTNWLTQFATQAQRIFEVLDTPVQIVERDDPVRLPELRGQIEFRNVYFGYGAHNPVLRDVSFKIDSGEMIGIVGPSGSGKSTIVNLICRFYDVDEGKVCIDGVDVRDLAKEDARRHIGVVLQEPFLFRGSVWENLCYGWTEARVEQVLAAAKAGNCHDFILAKPHGYDTWVGERGAGLSGGERQRISIARVLLTDPKILILDEATSSVDAESEAAIQSALAELVRGRTTIAIAHRLSTLRHADRIIVLDNGRIAESGPHDALLRQGGIYARLVGLQGGAQPAADAAEAPPAGRLRWLTPDDTTIHLGNHNALHVTVKDERIYPGVFALRCLPVQEPRRYISLRHFDSANREREIGLIRDLSDWPEAARKLVEESLLKRYFVHTITRVHAIRGVPGFLMFDVLTDLGPLNFTIRNQGDRAQDYGPNGKILLDLDENRFLIPDLADLTDADRRLFKRYIYW